MEALSALRCKCLKCIRESMARLKLELSATRTLVLLAASTGLRQGELFGLKWRDIDFEHRELNVIRSIVCGVEGLCKT
jgi:integrase